MVDWLTIGDQSLFAVFCGRDHACKASCTLPWGGQLGEERLQAVEFRAQTFPGVGKTCVQERSLHWQPDKIAILYFILTLNFEITTVFTR